MGFFGFMLFVTVGSWYESTYDPNNTLQYFFNSRWHAITIYLVNYFTDISFIEGRGFNHITTK